jgi:signal transduction histidine kinase/ActR/RegA family two-component response regulator
VIRSSRGGHKVPAGRTVASSEASQHLPSALVWCLVALSVAPGLLILAGVDFGSPAHSVDLVALSRMSPTARGAELHLVVQGSFVHNLLEWTAVCLAAFTAILAFFHFGLTRNLLTPVIGVALLVSGCLDAVHILAADGLLRRVAAPTLFVPLTWTASRVFSCLVLLLGAAIVLVPKPSRNRWDKSLILGAAGLFGAGPFLLVEYGAGSSRLPQCMFPGRFVSRPYDLIPVALYLFVGYPLFRLLNRRLPGPFAHSLLVSIVPQAMAELHMSLGATTLYSAHSNVAHCLKIVAYAVPLCGLLLDYAQTYAAQSDLVVELERSSQVVEEERHVLELVATGASLHSVLDALTSGLERMAPGSYCAILLSDEEQRRLLGMSAPSLPPEYLEAVSGIAIGPDMGSSGSAAFHNRTVVVEDIAADHRFAWLKDRVLRLGLRSSCAVPIRDSKHAVLGVFSMYRNYPGTPRPRELRLVEAGARLAGNAIERLRAEEQLRANAARMALAEKTAGFGVWEADLENNCVTISEGLAALLGRPPGAPLKGPLDRWQDAVHPEDRESVRLAVESAVAAGTAPQVEFRLSWPDGSIRRVRGHARLDRSEGRPAKMTGALIDVTEEKKLLLRLEQARAEAETALGVRDEFLANMSHEIRTPLNGIIGTMSLLLDSCVSEEQKEHLRTIQNCGQTLLHLVNDILDVAKIEAGKLALERTPFQLREMVANAMAVVAPAAAGRGLELRQICAPDVPNALAGDPGRLQQILLNLLSNAVKFTEHGLVSLDVSMAGSGADFAVLRFAVRDTGIGIPANVQQAIFEPFAQADTSTTRRFGGTGLGLAICRSLVSLMGGKLELESQAGCGSTFSFTARLALAPDLPAPVSAAPDRIPQSSRNLRILLAEDNVINQKVAVRLLERMGHRVDIASDGREAVDAATRCAYDLVLMDCQMPNLDGYAATRAIRQLDPSRLIPIVAMTASATPEAQRRCREAGMDDFLTKPVVAARLYGLIETIAAGHPAALPQGQ